MTAFPGTTVLAAGPAMERGRAAALGGTTLDELPELYQRWVHPLYMQLLHGNFRGRLIAEKLSAERERMILDFRRCLAEADPSVVTRLIRQPEWRARLTGGWYAGLRGWLQFKDELGGLLVESRMCFACQGYCAALACYADEASAEYLCKYLDVWLSQVDKFYDQHWALPSLVWLDRRLNTQHAAGYLVPGGLWDRWATAHHREGRQFYLESQRNFDLTLASALATFRAA
jgi:hypothetical protein